MRPLIVLLLVSSAGAHAQEAQRFGALQYRRLVDDITDADRSIVYTDDVSASLARTGAATGRRGRLVWRCAGAEVEVFLRADSLQPDSSRVRWRVDDYEPSPVEFWQAGASGRSLFAPGGSARRLTSRSKGASRLVVRVLDSDGRDFDYTYDLAGSREAIGRLECDPNGRGTSTHRASGTTHDVGGSYRPDRANEDPWVHAQAGYFLPARR